MELGGGWANTRGCLDNLSLNFVSKPAKKTWAWNKILSLRAAPLKRAKLYLPITWIGPNLLYLNIFFARARFLMIRSHKMNILFYSRASLGACGKVHFSSSPWLLHDPNLHPIDVNSDNFLVLLLDFARFPTSPSRTGYYNGPYDDHDFEQCACATS